MFASVKNVVQSSPLSKSKKKCRLGLLLLLAQLQFAPSAILSEKRDANDINDLVRRAVANQKARQPLRNDYTYVAHYVGSVFDRRTKSKPFSSDDYEVMFLEGEQYMRHTRHNDQPLPPDQQKRDEITMQAFLKARREAKSKPRGFPFPLTTLKLPIEQLPDYFDLRGKGKQRLDGRDVHVIEALPRNEQRTVNADQEQARHFKIRLWIDAAEAQIVKIETEVVKDLVVTDALTTSVPTVDEAPQVPENRQLRFLYKPGATVSREWTKLSDGAWLPKHVQWKAERRIWLDLPDSDASSDWLESADWTYSDYKKFRVKTTILPAK